MADLQQLHHFVSKQRFYLFAFVNCGLFARLIQDKNRNLRVSICMQISANLLFTYVKGSTSFGIFVNTDRDIPELRPSSEIAVEGDLGTWPL